MLIEKSRLSFRPSAYALTVHEGKVLMTIMRSTGKFTSPGGGVDIGETLEDALKREVMEECGVEVVIERQLFFKERFFYYQPLDKAWQVIMCFFLCRSTKVFEISPEFDPSDKDDESIKPQWVDISSLRAEDFQVCGEEIVKMLQECV